MSAIVKEVEPGSIAEECGIRTDDTIVSINQSDFCDILDYRFLIADESLEIEVLKADQGAQIIEIEKDYSDDLGIIFQKDLIDDVKSCKNKCIFCFIDQLPKGLRKTLYFKDDDARMSFLLGNYITMTNLSEHDLERIMKMHISPINISVHTTDPDLRRFMLKNKNAGKLYGIMQKLYDAQITMNCQIVSCPGINDGEQLDRTLSDLSGLFPQVESISVVPVGVTRYREGLHNLQIYDKNSAAKIIKQVQKWQEKFLRKYNKRYLYLADEFYLLAGIPIPPYEEYEGFPQIENGVGLIANLREEFESGLAEQMNAIKRAEEIHKTIACGCIVQEFLNFLMDKLNKINSLIKIEVVPIENRFLGETITVSGLICGCDLIEQLKNKDLGSEILISSAMLKADQDIFLDDVTIAKAEQKLKTKITKVNNDGYELIHKILA